MKIQAAEFIRIQPLGLNLGFTPAQTRAKGRDLWKPVLKKLTDTVSQTVSERGERAVENSGGLKWIIIGFTGVFASLLRLNRTGNVAARLRPPKQGGTGRAATSLSPSAASGDRILSCAKDRPYPRCPLRGQKESQRDSIHQIR